MRLVIQRVKRASVTAYSEPVPAESVVTGEIGAGLVVLVGITHDDGGAPQIEKAARKIVELKLLRGDATDDPAQRVGAVEVGAPVMLVSQFTLYADTKKGRKPSWSHAAPGDVAEPIFDQLVEAVRAHGVEVATGAFGAMMDVELVNDGPFTILVEV